MSDVTEEEDCLGKLYDPAAVECRKCQERKKCKQTMEEKSDTEKEREKKFKKGQSAAQLGAKEGEPKRTVEEKLLPAAEIERQIINPFRPGSGAAYAFDLLIEGGTKNELIGKLDQVVKKLGLKIDPRKRLVRVAKAIRLQKEEKLRPYQLLEEGRGGWKNLKVVKRQEVPEGRREE